jgi:membrane protein
VSGRLVDRLAEPTRHWAARLKTVLKMSVIAWIDHRAGSKSAALAFFSLFSMTPILILSIALAGYFFGADAAEGRMVAQLEGVLGPNGAQAIQALLADARDPDAELLATLVAGVLLLIGATSVFVDLKGSLDELWGVAPSRRSAFRVLLRARLLSFGLVLVLAFLLLASLVVNAALAVLGGYAHAVAGNSIVFLATVTAVASYLIIACLFAIIYKTLPDTPLSWRDVGVGAAFTAGLVSLGNYAISLYLSNSGVASSFGAAGSFIALLLWVYYSAQIFFLGAEFTRQYALCFGSLQPAQAPDPRGEPPD